jgi:hypothetical protein
MPGCGGAAETYKLSNNPFIPEYHFYVINLSKIKLFPGWDFGARPMSGWPGDLGFFEIARN